jgi:hypothetical protein
MARMGTDGTIDVGGLGEDLIILESGPEDDPVADARLRRVTGPYGVVT